MTMKLGVILLCISSTNVLPLEAVKFPKDQRINIRFPPIVELPISPELPTGHLRPIGHQSGSSGEVSQGDVTNWNSTDSFIFRALLPNESNYNIWLPSDTGSPGGNDANNVLVAKRQRGGSTFYQNMDMSKFLDDYNSEEWILEQVLNKDLLQKIKMPAGFECLTKNLLHVSSSLTSGITSDDIKVGAVNKLQCVLNGRRDYIVLRNDSTMPTTTSKHTQTICGTEATINLNPESINLFDNPWIVSTPWNHASLYTGDCILLPAGTVFHTTSYGECETVTFNWGTHATCEQKKEADENEKGTEIIEPAVCADGNNLVQLCDCNYLTSDTEWHQLLLSVMNMDGFLTKSCIATLANSEEKAVQTLELFQTDVITVDDINKFPTESLNNIKSIMCPDKLKHSHDEL